VSHLALNVIDVGGRRPETPGGGPAGATLVAPNGTDTEYFKPNGTAAVAGARRICGTTHSHPNRDAVEFLLQEIWPASVLRTAPLLTIGWRQPGDRSRALRSHAWACTALDTYRTSAALAEARCCVVPIRIGGGRASRSSNAWAMGKAVVSTSDRVRGARGSGRREHPHPRCAGCIADAVLQVLRDDTLRSHLEAERAMCATERYS